MTRNHIAVVALLCGTALGITVIATGGTATEAVALVGTFTTIAGAAAELRGKDQL